MNVLQMSVSAGILILAIVVVRALAINKLPKTMFTVLWGIALCRLLIPFSIPSGFSIYTIINRIREAFFMKAQTANDNWYVSSLLYKGTGYTETASGALHPEPMAVLWIAGAAILILFFAAAFYRCYNEIRTALPVRGNALIDKWLSEQNTKRSIKVLVSDKITTPFTYGIIKPKIIFPKSADFSDELQMKYILTHELVHIKRFDTLWKLALIIALCCHWFNPMAWVLYILMNRDLEITCDEKVIRLFGEDTKSAYALSLIKMAESRARFTPLYSSFSKNATEERIVSIMKFRKTSLLGLAVAFALVIGATSVFAESTPNTDFKAYGVIQIDSARLSFTIDDRGIITVKDADGKTVSTAIAGSDGKVTLIDGDGSIIKILQLYIPDFKTEGEKFFKFYKSTTLSGEIESNFEFFINMEN